MRPPADGPGLPGSARATNGPGPDAHGGAAPARAQRGAGTLAARGPGSDRGARARLPDREAAGHAGRVSAEPQRAAARVQPVDQPRPGGPLRRGDDPGGAAPPRAAALDATGERSLEPRGEVPAPARRGARPGPR